MSVNYRNMATLHAYFKSIPSSCDDTVIPVCVRGRPLSGAGSHGGTSLCIVRDSHSRRVHKRKRINASAAANSAMGVQSSASPEVNDSESDEEPSLPKRNRVNWSSPTRHKMLCSAIHMVQQHKVSVKRAAKLHAIPCSVLHTSCPSLAQSAPHRLHCEWKTR